MKLLCINDGEIPSREGTSTNDIYPVKAGKTYTSLGPVFTYPSGDRCYFIREVGNDKRVERFIPLSDIDETEFERNYNFKQSILTK